MRLFRSSPIVAGPEDVARLGRELVKLDPWAFWTVELDSGAGSSFAVLGITGAFVAAPCGLEGYLVAEGRRLLVDGREVGGYRDVRRVAKTLKGKLLSVGASSTDVTPVIVLTRAMAGAPRERAGVRVLRPEDVLPAITARERVLDPSTAERLARSLGRVLAGPVERPPDEQ
ncbi:MAG: hypothetical protein ACXWXQ_07370 [Actinomycetota bacterium]